MLSVVTKSMPNNNTTYIIFGASGDLAKRYLLPALEHMQDRVKVVKISRKDYNNLKNLIPENKENKCEKIFHLAIPPSGVLEAVELISKNFGRENIKIVCEKPFGTDLASAEKLVAEVGKYFSEDQIYRVDHYLAKKSLGQVASDEWKKENIVKVEILASEKIDIEGRVNFYEQTGALKDFVQSHLLEMTAVTLARSFDIPAREKVLKNLEIVCNVNETQCVKRGQYEGYTDEVGNPSSTTETFVSLNLVLNDPAWRGVSITLSTGKAMKEKLTQIKIAYKNGSEKIFNIESEPDAYERVISSAIAGDQHLFISSTEVLETWRILDRVQEAWKSSPNNLTIYKKGSAIRDIL